MADKKAPTEKAGRFEATEKKFAELTKSKSSDLVTLDLKKALPDIFVGGSDRIPRLVQRVWRRACDEIMSEDTGIYFYKGGTIIKLYFYDMSVSIAKVKVEAIQRKISTLLKTVQSGDESALDSPLPDSSKSSTKSEGEKQQSVASMVRTGLPDNPTIEMIRMWSTRALQEMMAAQKNIPMTRGMIDVASKADIIYKPIWNAAGQVIVGSFGSIKVEMPVSQYETGEIYRQDLALLFSACFQIYSLISKGGSALTIIPAHISSLNDKDVGQLYFGLLRRLSPEAQKNIIIELTGLPKGTIAESLSTTVDALAQCTRAVSFQTSILQYEPYKKQLPKLHACGFDSEGMHIDEHEQVRLMKKYSETYQKQGLQTFIKNIVSPYVFDAAIKNKTTYISGAFIRPAQKSIFAMQKLSAEDIKAQHQTK